MSDKIYLGSNVSELDTSPAFLPFSKVVIIVGEDENQLVYEAGDNTGRALEVEIPWGTQQMANDMLARIRGYAYQPFSASDALLDPAAELGDAVTVGGIYSVLAEQDFNFNALGAADVSAPSDGEIDHEFPYEEESDRQIKRRIAQVWTSFLVETGKIESRIDDEVNGMSSRITQLAESISVEVTSKNGKTTISITGDGIAASTGEINLTVDAMNINGKLSANQITVTDASISGKLSASKINMTGAITWGDLDSNAQAVVSGAYSQSADADAKATSAQNTVSGWVYPGTTEIDGQMIRAGTVEASYLRGGAVQLLDANKYQVGVMTLTPATSSAYAVDLTSYGALRLAALRGAVYLSGSYVGLGAEASVAGNIYPTSTNRYSCGTSGFKWTDVYATNATIQTSDLKQKKDVAYGLEAFDEFFDKMKPCTYKFKEGHGRTHFGLIAQDIEDLIDECGFDTMDVAAFIKSWNKETETYDYALRYAEFIPLLIYEVQNLKNRVRELNL